MRSAVDSHAAPPVLPVFADGRRGAPVPALVDGRRGGGWARGVAVLAASISLATMLSRDAIARNSQTGSPPVSFELFLGTAQTVPSNVNYYAAL